MPHKDPEQRKAYDYAYYQARRDQILPARRAHRQANLEEIRAKDRARPRNQKDYLRAYTMTHREEINAKHRAWNLAHPEQTKAIAKAYHKAHLEGAASRQRKRRSRKKGVAHQPYKVEEVIARVRLRPIPLARGRRGGCCGSSAIGCMPSAGPRLRARRLPAG